MLLFSYLPQYNSNLYLTLSHRFKKASLLTKKELRYQKSATYPYPSDQRYIMIHFLYNNFPSVFLCVFYFLNYSRIFYILFLHMLTRRQLIKNLQMLNVSVVPGLLEFSS